MTLEECINRGNAAMESQDWHTAYEAWFRVHQACPDHPWTNAKLGRIHLELDQFEEAERFLLADVEAYPERPFALANLAKVAQKQAKWQLAQTRWERVREKFPDYEWALQPYAQTLKKLGELDKAERYYQMDIALHPYHVDSSLALIDIAAEKGRLKLTQQRINRFVEQNQEKSAAVAAHQDSLRLTQKKVLDENYADIDLEAKWLFRYDPELKYVYCVTPKVASSTITASLYYLTHKELPPKGAGFGKTVRDSYTRKQNSNLPIADQIKSAVARSDHFVFTFTRNPYTRILSAYLFGIQRPGESQKYRPLFGFKPLGREEVSFLNFLKRIQEMDVCQLDAHFQPQWNLLGLHKSIQYDFIGRFENLEADLRYVLHRIFGDELPDSAIESRKHPTHASEKINEFYGEQEQALVAELYADDFKMLGYGRALPI